ncbi:transcription factor bHLH128 isoform X1 [Triticum aestivum]|uniref:BHLH domain-containing protein n=1 Tax=Triticum turgidum subsp. durum TaxID=4567 RepID=A0A9R1BB84_TRITD|nr:transcription factor bHLH128-like isoform X1 [Triticum aestivum]VAI58241.1 unnamed protein product [Triticum turgidum subsp. durum]
MRRFLPAGAGEPSSSSSSGPHGKHEGSEAAAAGGGLRYGGGDISLGRGNDLLHGQFRGGEGEMKDDGADMLARHSSSPAGFFSNLMVDDAGYHGSRGAGVAGGSVGGEAHRNTSSSTKMKSQLSFTAGGPQTAAHLSRISEGASLFPGAAAHPGGEHPVSRSFSASGSSGGFSIVGPWDESREIIGTLDLGGYESQFSGMASSSSLELAGMDKYMQAQQQQDQVAFKVRAKRGCATHPRSIAERERRTRISDKLRKLQDLVPNMDKQTSTSDMLDLAVEHIKGLQSQLQAMKHEQDKCTCCNKP